MRAGAVAAALVVLVAASAVAQVDDVGVGRALSQALAEEADANARAARMEQLASGAHTQAERLRAEQQAASEGIEAAEARISAADVRVRMAAAYVAAHRQELATEQQPVALLVAGLATMARRPPLLVLASGGGTDELVKVRLLLDATLPTIRNRTGKVAAELAKGEQLERAARASRTELANSRQQLEVRRQRYAALEKQALQQELATGGQLVGASDAAMAAGEDVQRLRAEEKGSQSIRRLAEVLAQEAPAPASPFKPGSSLPPFPFAYELPAAAPVTQGLGAVNDSGVLARGITMATARGAPIVAPADGTVRFAGPYRDYDGVLIIDHGGGWLTLIVNAASQLRAGEKVVRGEQIGQALGPLQVELSRNERRISPALIAGSSQNLSKEPKGG